MISVIGRKNSGKTTLIIALAQQLVRRGHRVATLKHGHHPVTADREGKDTWRHYHEGGVAKVLIESPGERVLFERTTEETDPETLTRAYLDDTEIVLVEGFSRDRLPKIEVHRRGLAEPPIFDPERPDASDWIAIVTDDATLRTACPRFTFNDTSWLHNLTRLAWARAIPLDD